MMVPPHLAAVAPVISLHAIERYRQRVEDVSPREVVRRLDGPALRAAIAFGASALILGSGHRLVIMGDTVVTVRPIPPRTRVRHD